ncbi:hypothetical protein ABN763_04105 [Spongiivirga sp. MCCC 1A20706]|uniref:HYC_CC_PP family protein n=1 Tax=Spongiivirga sp. MCCC 1A20706 TaxID=3160963 RepID=UPI0039779286
MKKLLYQITAVVLSLILLLASLSFTIDMHHCGKTLVDFALFEDAHGCGMKMDADKEPSSTFEISKKACCTDTFIAVEAQDELNETLVNLDVDQRQFLVAFTFSYIDLFEGFAKNIIPFDGYPPPILVKDIHILNETFLI